MAAHKCIMENFNSQNKLLIFFNRKFSPLFTLFYMSCTNVPHHDIKKLNEELQRAWYNDFSHFLPTRLVSSFYKTKLVQKQYNGFYTDYMRENKFHDFSLEFIIDDTILSGSFYFEIVTQGLRTYKVSGTLNGNSTSSGETHWRMPIAFDTINNRTQSQGSIHTTWFFSGYSYRYVFKPTGEEEHTIIGTLEDSSGMLLSVGTLTLNTQNMEH
jgi:hypothetical protein